MSVESNSSCVRGTTKQGNAFPHTKALMQQRQRNRWILYLISTLSVALSVTTMEPQGSRLFLVDKAYQIRTLCVFVSDVVGLVDYQGLNMVIVDIKT